VKIALQGDQFGAVELHAKMTGDQVSASISVEHRETHAMLSGELPLLHQLLNERQLRVNEIILLHHSLSSSSSSDDDPPTKYHETSTQETNGASVKGSEGLSSPSGVSNAPTDAMEIFDFRGRLSVRA
jgi:hypothetical protein